MEFKDKIKRKRNELGLTLDEVAKKVGVSTPTIQRYESGEIKNLRRDKIKLLSDALKVTPSYLMGWDEPDTNVTVAESRAFYGTSKEVPLYGSIAAGLPLEMIEVKEYIEIPMNVAQRYPNAFLLQINGDSMNKVVPNGMYALIDPADDIKNGDAVAVNVDGFEATLKRFYRLQNTMVLEPDSHNLEHEAQIYECSKSKCSEIKILGKMVWFMAPIDTKF